MTVISVLIATALFGTGFWSVRVSEVSFPLLIERFINSFGKFMTRIERFLNPIDDSPNQIGRLSSKMSKYLI